MPQRQVSMAVLGLRPQIRSQFVLSTTTLASSRLVTSALLCSRNASTKASLPVRAAQRSLPTKPLHKTKGLVRNKQPSDEDNRSSATVVAVKFHSLIDPPASTHPPPLEIPERGPGKSKIAHLFVTGKAYWKFYKTGVKQTWANMKAARVLRREKQLPFNWCSVLIRDLSKNHPMPLSSQPENPGLDEGKEHREASFGNLTRAEFQFLRRENSDTLRLPVFALILLLFGEWTPALVVLFGGIIPYPCRIPRQVHRSLRKRHEAREARLTRLTAAKNKQAAKDGHNVNQQSSLLEIDRTYITYALAYRLGTYSAFADVLDLTERRLIRHLRYLDADDAMLRRDAGGSCMGAANELSKDEVRTACDERGLDVLRRTGEKDKKGRPVWKEIPEVEMRKELKDWLQKGGWKSSKAMEGLY